MLYPQTAEGAFLSPEERTGTAPAGRSDQIFIHGQFTEDELKSINISDWSPDRQPI